MAEKEQKKEKAGFSPGRDSPGCVKSEAQRKAAVLSKGMRLFSVCRAVCWLTGEMFT
ncbi:hypothetical protein NXW84_09130 [Bacteroides fragilis]|nr:hypothetical protein NXW84_09130 [Bacteroides fragilis]